MVQSNPLFNIYCNIIYERGAWNLCRSFGGGTIRLTRDGSDLGIMICCCGEKTAVAISLFRLEDLSSLRDHLHEFP